MTVQERGVVRDNTEDSDLNACRGGRVNRGAEELVLGWEGGRGRCESEKVGYTGAGESAASLGDRGMTVRSGRRQEKPDPEQGFGLPQGRSAAPRALPHTPRQEQGDFSCTGERGVHPRNKAGVGMPLTELRESTGRGAGARATGVLGLP